MLSPIGTTMNLKGKVWSEVFKIEIYEIERGNVDV